MNPNNKNPEDIFPNRPQSAKTSPTDTVNQREVINLMQPWMKQFIIYSVPELKNSIALVSVIGNKSFRNNFKILIGFIGQINKHKMALKNKN